MDTHRYDQDRKRPVWFSPLVLAVVLSPVVLQGSLPSGCTPLPPGDTTLSELAVIVGGVEQIEFFDASQRSYDVWLPLSADTALVRAVPTIPYGTQVSVSLRTGSERLDAMPWTVGGGEVVIPLEPGTLTLLVNVFPPPPAFGGGVVGQYTVGIQVGCSQCSDGNECTADTCDPVVEHCVHTPVGDGTPCDFASVGDGFCNAGVCWDRTWGIPQLVDTSRHPANYPTVAVNSAGNAVAVWRQDFSLTSRFPHEIWASYYTTSTGWGEPELLESIQVDAQLPQVVMDEAGNAIAIWEAAGTTQDIWTNRYTPAGGWGGAELLETEDDVYAMLGSDDNSIAMAPDGNAVVVWSQWDNELPPLMLAGYKAMARRYIPGVGWAAPEVLSDTWSSTALQVGWDGSGNAMALWELRGIRSKRYTPGGGWSTSLTLVSDFDVGHSARLAVDPAGNAVAVWMQTGCPLCVPAITGGIFGNRYSVDVGWGSPQLLYAESSLPILGFDVVANGAGDAVVVWREGRKSGVFGPPTEVKLWAVRCSQGAWEAPETLLDAVGSEPVNADFVGDPVPAADGAGNFIVLWGAYDPTVLDPDPEGVMSIRFVDGAGWGAPTSIENNGARGPAVFPRVAFAPDGSAMAVWADVDVNPLLVPVHDIWAVRLHP